MGRIIGRSKKKKKPWKKLPRQKYNREEEVRNLETTRMIHQGTCDQDAYAIASFINVEYINCLNLLMQKRKELKKLKRRWKLEKSKFQQKEKARVLEVDISTLSMKREIFQKENNNLCVLLRDKIDEITSFPKPGGDEKPEAP